MDGGQAIITAIGSGPDVFRLLDLDLAYNSLGAGCGDSLAVAIRRNETLTRLSLRCVREFSGDATTDGRPTSCSALHGAAGWCAHTDTSS